MTVTLSPFSAACHSPSLSLSLLLCSCLCCHRARATYSVLVCMCMHVRDCANVNVRQNVHRKRHEYEWYCHFLESYYGIKWKKAPHLLTNFHRSFATCRSGTRSRERTCEWVSETDQAKCTAREIEKQIKSIRKIKSNTHIYVAFRSHTMVYTTFRAVPHRQSSRQAEKKKVLPWRERKKKKESQECCVWDYVVCLIWEWIRTRKLKQKTFSPHQINIEQQFWFAVRFI